MPFLTVTWLWQCGQSIPFSLTLPLYFISHALNVQCRVWQDDAATEFNGRYFRPHKEDSQQSLTALSRQLQLLNETDTKLQTSGQLILEANRLSEEIEKLINFANQDISRSHSEYSVFQEQNSAARSEIPIITQLINQANSCCG